MAGHSGRSRAKRHLFDDLISGGEQRCRNDKSELLRGSAVDDQLRLMLAEKPERTGSVSRSLATIGIVRVARCADRSASAPTTINTPTSVVDQLTDDTRQATQLIAQE